MTTAVATLDRNLAGTTTATPAIRELTVEEYGWIAGAECNADICITIEFHGLSSIDWGDAIAWGAGGAAVGAYGGGLFGAIAGGVAGAASSIFSDLVDIHVETGSS